MKYQCCMCYNIFTQNNVASDGEHFICIPCSVKTKNRMNKLEE